MLKLFEKNYVAFEAMADFFVVIAIIIGGAWAIFQFAYRIRNQRLRAQSNIKLGLQIDQLSQSGSDGRVLSIRVSLRNDGDQNTYVPLGRNDHLSITRVEFDEVGEKTFGNRQEFTLRRGNRTVDTIGLLYGAETELPFLAKVSEPGYYHVRFYFEPTAEQRSVVERAGGADENTDLVNSTNCYVQVH